MTAARPLQVVFFKTEAGNEPVREWLKSLPKDERYMIGEDIKKVQWGSVGNAVGASDGGWAP